VIRRNITLLVLCASLHIAYAPVAVASSPRMVSNTLLTATQYNVATIKVASDVTEALTADTKLPREPPPKALSAALVDLAPIVRCTVGYGGSVVYVDNRPLRSTLTRASTTSGARRDGILKAVIQQLALVQSGTSFVTDGQSTARAGDAARTVLRQYEFGSDPYQPPTWSEKQMNKFGDEIRHLLEKLHGGHMAFPTGHIDPNVAKAIAITIAIIAVSLLFGVIYQQISLALWKRQRTVSSVESGLALTQQEAALVSSRNFSQLLAVAKESAAAGDYRTAYRLVYLAMLVLLDATGNVRLRRSRTNWEYLAHIRSSDKDELYSLMLPLTEEFDRIWYGYGRVDAGDFSTAVSGYEAIDSHVRPLIQASSRVKVSR
jgi:hypothetical protein